MTLASLLARDRAALCERWAESADAAYPFAAAGLLRTQRNAFANPVGTRTREAASLLLTAILDENMDEDALRPGLEEFIRVRAVQDMTAEQAVAPVFAFKAVIRRQLAAQKTAMTDETRTELTALEDRIDALALLSFGLYARCRDDLHEMQLKDVKRRHSQLLRYMQRHGLAAEDDAEAGPQ